MFRAVASAGARKAVAPLQKKKYIWVFLTRQLSGVLGEDGWNVTND